MHRILSFFTLSILAVAALGCGGGTAGAQPARGKVVRSDGQPVTSGTINFRNDQASFSSGIKEDGTFELGGNTPGDGAMPGKYKVYFSGDVLGGGYENKPPQIDAKYGAPETSGLEYEVKAGTNTFEIKVDPPAGGAAAAPMN